MLFTKKYKLANIFIGLVLLVSAMVVIAPARASAITAEDKCRQKYTEDADVYNCVLTYNSLADQQCAGRDASSTNICKQSLIDSTEASNSIPTVGSKATGDHQCGTGTSAQKISFNLGCKGEICAPNNTGSDPICGKNINPIVDMLFAFIRFLSIGVGMVIVGSMIVAGIQFTVSKSEPQKVAAARDRILHNLLAFGIYIFIYAILNYLVPSQVF